MSDATIVIVILAIFCIVGWTGWLCTSYSDCDYRFRKKQLKFRRILAYRCSNCNHAWMLLSNTKHDMSTCEYCKVKEQSPDYCFTAEELTGLHAKGFRMQLDGQLEVCLDCGRQIDTDWGKEHDHLCSVCEWKKGVGNRT